MGGGGGRRRGRERGERGGRERGERGGRERGRRERINGRVKKREEICCRVVCLCWLSQGTELRKLIQVMSD